MVANLAASALRSGVPMAANAFAKRYPGQVQKAKTYAAKALGIEDPKKVNLYQLSRQDNGNAAQLVAESMVKAGMPVNELWKHMPSSTVNNDELNAYRATLSAIQQQESDESSARALGGSVSRNLAAQLDEKNRSIRFLMKMLGTNDPAEVWNFKVEMDHLHEQDIDNFALLNA